jgi:hypothetical protein
MKADGICVRNNTIVFEVRAWRGVLTIGEVYEYRTI